MPHFFFHLWECGTLVTDEEGQELSDSSAARDQAFIEARHIMAAEVAAGHLCLACRIEIEDADHVPVMAVWFKEALELSGL